MIHRKKTKTRRAKLRMRKKWEERQGWKIISMQKKRRRRNNHNNEFRVWTWNFNVIPEQNPILMIIRIVTSYLNVFEICLFFVCSLLIAPFYFNIIRYLFISFFDVYFLIVDYVIYSYTFCCCCCCCCAMFISFFFALRLLSH